MALYWRFNSTQMAQDKINFHLPAQLKAAIHKRAQAQYKSISQYLRDLVQKDLEEWTTN